MNEFKVFLKSNRVCFIGHFLARWFWIRRDHLAVHSSPRSSPWRRAANCESIWDLIQYFTPAL